MYLARWILGATVGKALLNLGRQVRARPDSDSDVIINSTILPHYQQFNQCGSKIIRSLQVPKLRSDVFGVINISWLWTQAYIWGYGPHIISLSLFPSHPHSPCPCLCPFQIQSSLIQRLKYLISLPSVKMHLSSDLFLNAAKLSPVHISKADKQLNEDLLGITLKRPDWWEVRDSACHTFLR